MKHVPLVAFAAAAVMLPGVSMEAQQREPIDVSALGPQVGERVPDFSLPDQHGRMQTLQSVMGEKGAMILFHRSADW